MRCWGNLGFPPAQLHRGCQCWTVLGCSHSAVCDAGRFEFRRFRSWPGRISWCPTARAARRLTPDREEIRAPTGYSFQPRLVSGNPPLPRGAVHSPYKRHCRPSSWSLLSCRQLPSPRFACRLARPRPLPASLHTHTHSQDEVLCTSTAPGCAPEPGCLCSPPPAAGLCCFSPMVRLRLEPGSPGWPG